MYLDGTRSEMLELVFDTEPALHQIASLKPHHMEQSNINPVVAGVHESTTSVRAD